MPNDVNPNNDNQKKGLLQSLHSLSFDDDDTNTVNSISSSSSNNPPKPTSVGGMTPPPEPNSNTQNLNVPKPTNNLPLNSSQNTSSGSTVGNSSSNSNNDSNMGSFNSFLRGSNNSSNNSNMSMPPKPFDTAMPPKPQGSNSGANTVMPPKPQVSSMDSTFSSPKNSSGIGVTPKPAFSSNNQDSKSEYNKTIQSTKIDEKDSKGFSVPRFFTRSGGNNDSNKPGTPQSTPSNLDAPKKPLFEDKKPMQDTTEFSQKSVSVSMGDSTSTLYDIENKLNTEMKKNMDAVKQSAKNIKAKSQFDLITSFGSGITEAVVFNTFLNQEIPYTYKNGKTANQRVHAFGVMTGYGVYTIRSSSAVTPKLEDALKYSHQNTSNEVGVLGEGSSRRIVLNLPPEEYGEDKVLDIPLVTSKKDLEAHVFTGLDAISVDMDFIEDLMSIAVEEVQAMVDYEDKRKANLQLLQSKTAAELKKATAIADKLNSINI